MISIKKIVCLMLLISFICFGYSQSPAELVSRADRIVENARSEIGFYDTVLSDNVKKLLDNGILLYGKAISLDPNNRKYYIQCGIAKELKMDYRGAIKEFTKAIQLDTGNNKYYTYCSRADVKVSSKDFLGAYRDYDSAVYLQPENYYAYEYRGIAKYKGHKFVEAQIDLDKALDLSPNGNSFAKFYLGSCKRALGDSVGACIDWMVAANDGNLMNADDSLEHYCKFSSEFSFYDWDIAKSKLDSIIKKKDFNNAFSQLLVCIKIASKLFGKNDDNYISLISWQGYLFHELKKYESAEKSYREAINCYEIKYGHTNKDVAWPLENLAVLKLGNGELIEADSLYKEAINITEHVFGKASYNYAEILYNSARVFRQTGAMEKCHSIKIEALQIQAKLAKKNTADYGDIMYKFGQVYFDMGEFGKSEECYLNALSLREKLYGKLNDDYGQVANSLGLLYFQLGNPTKAEQLLTQSFEIIKKLGDENSIEFATAVGNLARLYELTDNDSRSELYYLWSTEIGKKNIEIDSIHYAGAINNLAGFYVRHGSAKRALALYYESLGIYKLRLGTFNIEYARTINNIANVYAIIGEVDSSISLLKEALFLRKKIYGTNHFYYHEALCNLGVAYETKEDYASAEPLFVEALDIGVNQLNNDFSFLSESDQEKYLANYESTLLGFQSFSLKQYPFNNAIATKSYDLALTQKGIILSSSINLRERILTSSDSLLLRKLNQYQSIKAAIVELYSQPIADRKIDPLLLEREANELEKELMRLSVAFKEYSELDRINTKSVQQKLRKDEAAIEFVSFPYFNGVKWTDSIFYVAYIISEKDSIPKLVFLFEEKELDSLFVLSQSQKTQNFLARFYANEDQNKTLYSLLWKNIDPYLKDTKTVYYSPSGKLNKISFAAISLNDTQILSDKYNLIALSSTRELAKLKENYKVTASTSIALFGGIKYDADTLSMKDAAALYHATTSELQASRSLPDNETRSGNAKFSYLYGTLLEVDSINQLFKNSRIFTSTLANEEAVKSLQGNKAPEILHLATHGFFYKEDRTKKDKEGKNVFVVSADPMLRTGLVFAGGNRKWKGEVIPEGIEDGILTAKEVANMNFSNTKLVVLSACNTGLGDIKGSEGVYGLQRAFKVAGVEYLMMSLWSVPDIATVEFMESFYGNLKTGSDIQSAFHSTQTEMKQKYKDPYYWAAFVLLR
jgi:CHAT domain-containing protein/Tfp pilus assembly protein PilF